MIVFKSVALVFQSPVLLRRFNQKAEAKIMFKSWIGDVVQSNDARREAQRVKEETKLREDRIFQEQAGQLWESVKRILEETLEVYNEQVEPQRRLRVGRAAGSGDTWVITRTDGMALGAYSVSFDRSRREISGQRSKPVLAVAVDETKLRIRESEGAWLTDDEVAERLLKDFLSTQ